MKIEEARKVLWLKSNPRPLGELLDEGYLTRDRLEWAAQWAYNFKLKEAAQVLLNTLKLAEQQAEEKVEAPQRPVEDKTLPINITLEKARETVWPFKLYKGQPMGSLVESGQLSLQDLTYAIENAWDERVRRAATAFALMRLEQAVKEPPPSAGYIRVVSGGRSYAERWITALTFIQGFSSGIILAGAVWYLALLLARPSTANGTGHTTVSWSDVLSSPPLLLAVIIVLLVVFGSPWLVGFAFDRLIKRMDKAIENHRFGQDGEDRVCDAISRALDGTWCLFRSVALPGRNRGDLDAVLVGPPGVWVLEIKSFRGVYRNIGEKWEYRRGKKWRDYRKSPSRQARNNAARLGGFLKAENIKIFVNSTVVWANPESPLTIENPSTAVWPLDRLPDELGNIWFERKIPESDQKAIVEKLTKLCERQRSEK